MGGRVAMAYGASYPQDLSGLVIEDMDIRTSSRHHHAEPEECSSEDLQARREVSSDRSFPSFAALEKSLSRWYEVDRIRRWKEDGRVFMQPDGCSWWCGVNPLAQYYARKMVLASVGEAEWTACGMCSTQYSFPVHVFVAGRLSACSAESVARMVSLVPRAQIHHFSLAEHSIHRTDADNFVNTINTIIIRDALQYQSTSI